MMPSKPGSSGLPAPYAPRLRSIACRQCRSRKTKCSGERPCDYCKKANQAAECEYPKKDRHVKVSQQYIDELVAENQELHARLAHSRNAAVSQAPTPKDRQVFTDASTSPDTSPQEAEAEAEAEVEVESTPWFVSMQVPHTPILLAEASDSAFATRFRQAVATSEQGHFPRISFPPETRLQSLSDGACAWPSHTEACLLVNASVLGLGRWHHVVRLSVVLKELVHIRQHPKDMSSLRRCKFWALFAIGKMHITRTSNVSLPFPGLEYFAKGIEVLREMKERPTVEAVETYLLLSYYALCLNRRHSAYNLAGLAVRTGVIMGLHLNVPVDLLPDHAVREHRTRVWWTAYIFDRMWAIKLGYPVTIQDEDISVSLPSNTFANNDFADSTCMTATISLSRISGQILRSIYGGHKQLTPLSQRVNDCLRALRKWYEELDPSLKLHSASSEGTSQGSPVSLHLLFNQLTILATRPVLLHVFKTRFSTALPYPASTVPASAKALCDTCIQCARSSKQILLDAWLNGSFMLFDYFYAQNLFLTATILAISSLVNYDTHHSDLEHLDALILLLSQLKDSGNFVAAEFKQHIDAIRPLLDLCYAKIRSQNTGSQATQGAPASEGVTSQRPRPSDGDTAGEQIAAPALSDPLFYDLLTQPLPDLDFIDASFNTDSAIGFFWPTHHPDDDEAL